MKKVFEIMQIDENEIVAGKESSSQFLDEPDKNNYEDSDCKHNVGTFITYICENCNASAVIYVIAGVCILHTHAH